MGADMKPIHWVELCCGAAAVTLRLLGGEHLVPPVSWMGGKRRHASTILAAMGIGPRQPVESILLADAMEWGWVWPMLLDPEACHQVAEVLRSWEPEDPRKLWERLAAEPLPAEPIEGAATWLWVQARAASGVPVWWNGDAYRQADHATGRNVVAGQTGGRSRLGWRMGEEPGKARRKTRTISQAHTGWRMGSGPRDGGRDRRACPKGTGGGRPRGLLHTTTLARRIEAIADTAARWLVVQSGNYMGKAVTIREGRWVTHGFSRPSLAAQSKSGSCYSVGRLLRRVDAIAQQPHPAWSVFHGDAAQILPFAGAHVYVDPPYVNRTGYGCDLAREDVIAVAQRWADAGSVVAISEAVPIQIPGWHHVDITSAGRRGAGPEWLTMSKAPAAVPATQLELGLTA